VTLVLVRHAESTGNAGGIIQGWSDTPLTEGGHAQALAVAARLAEQPIAAVYTSPLARARDTARPIAERAGLGLVERVDLRERNYGQAQGLTWQQAAERWPLGEAEHHRDWAAAVPGVESLAALRQRAVATVSELLDLHEGEVAVCVSHGGTLVQVVAHLFGLPVDTWPRVRISNTSVTVVAGPAREPVIAVLNDVCHLDDPDRARTAAL
jgi:2,3-bisphosphoglycerate-dependent phosphoglycerate mutase